MVVFRPATLDDLFTLQAWDQEPHVIASSPNDVWDWETELASDPAWREQFIAEVESRPIGIVQIIDPAEEVSHYWGKDVPSGKRAIDIWIGPQDCLGRGFGTEMMHLAIAHCFADPSVDVILIDPLRENLRAIQFYRRLGFQFLEERKFGEDICHVHSLTRSSWRNQDSKRKPNPCVGGTGFRRATE